MRSHRPRRRPGARPLKVGAFKDYCPIDTSSMLEAVLWATIKEAQVPPHQVVDVQVDCAKLDLFRSSDEDTSINPYITVLMMVEPNGRAQVLNLSRRIFLTAVESSLASASGQNSFEEGVKAAEDRAREVLDELMQGSGVEFRTESIRPLGMVARDDHAIYVAALQRYTMEGTLMTEISVGGLTLVGGHALTIRLQRDYDNPEQVETMVEEVRMMVRDVIAANEDTL